MKAEFVIPFVDAAIFVGEQVTEIKPVRGTLSILDELVTSEPINHVFSISGDLEGIALLAFSRDCAMKFASKSAGKELMVFDQSVSEIIVGIADQISSRFVSSLAKQGETIMVKESALIRGMYIPIPTFGSPVLEVQIEFKGFGLIKVIVSVRKRDVSLAA
ncbi:MAG: hypothetical protein WCG75_02110 [Armatimonadota bacterium]